MKSCHDIVMILSVSHSMSGEKNVTEHAFTRASTREVRPPLQSSNYIDPHGQPISS